MDSTQQHHEHQSSNTLPPSPPPSPPAARRRHKKNRDKDPFLALDPASVQLLTPSPPSSPTQQPDEPQENILIRFIWIPLIFTSFLLSLFLVNLSDRLRRTKSTSTPPSLLARLNPEPYQNSTNATWARDDSVTHVSPHDAISPRTAQSPSQPQKKRSWHLHKKIRKVAKLEISDAFEMRERVLVALVVVLVGVGWVGWMGAVWVFGRIWR